MTDAESRDYWELTTANELDLVELWSDPTKLIHTLARGTQFLSDDARAALAV
jgi:hypothetical protein